MDKKIRVLIVDDSAFMRKVISDILQSDARIQVIGTARNGQDALNKINTLSPDVVTLDVEMPVMDGLTTLEKIMLNHPLPVLMISSSTTDGAKKTLQAISMGAVDFITKPSGPISLDIHTIKEEIIAKVITATHANIKKQSQSIKIDDEEQYDPKYDNTIIAIGTSTGGPRALQKVLTYFSKHINASFLIVQHMPAGFTRSLADRLNMLANITVKEAEHGEVIERQTAYIAPGDFHMKVKQVDQTQVIELTKDDFVNNHRPSVDVLFESVGQLAQTNKIALVLTGMGKDGANGIKQMKQHDHHTIVIAESEQSAVVYGMPKAAIETNQVDKIISIDHIGESIEQLIKDTRRG